MKGPHDDIRPLIVEFDINGLILGFFKMVLIKVKLVICLLMLLLIKENKIWLHYHHLPPKIKRK